ncbi:T-cell surface antigen CD2-like isoform X2 [Engraulis encrasicolus]|uniref:T-cell surface antigen CD2-like isoform X2 n=1 Tax=Engraulis encrasicolus TaxID=184585 RepID=UPI002FCEA7C6
MVKGRKWTVQRPKQEDASFSCNVSNAVSWETAVQVITVEQTPVGWMIGIAVGGIATVVVAVLFCICCCKKHKDGVDVPEIALMLS